MSAAPGKPQAEGGRTQVSGATLPQRIGHYRIVRKLGEGGQGVVYAATDERLGRSVAIKMIRQATANERSRDRLWREARTAASVNHPNICQLYEIGEEGSELFIAMELLEGESLSARIAGGALPVADAAQTVLSVLAALDALHRRGLVHRDLKPSNVFLTPHGVKLLDFGLARPLEEAELVSETNLTLTGTIVGTPRYMAPEQLLGQPVDGRSDLFVAGAILFELLSGRPAFAGQTVMQIMHAVSYETPPVLGGSAAIAAVDRIIHRALAKKPGDRYQTAQAMADDLRAAMLVSDSSEQAQARPITRIIVLPLRILRSDPETDFLAFSLSDAVTNSLSGLGSLIVRSSLAASQFAGDQPDLEAIAKKADVDMVLTGTLLRAGDQVRVSAQLVEVPGGAVAWSHTAQAPLGDIFRLQDDVTQRIVESLSLPLTAREQGTLQHYAPASPKAYELYLRANPLSNEPSQWTVARDLYLECLREDPRYAPAWTRLGRLYRVIGMYSGEDPEEYGARAQDAFKRALEINPDLSLAHNLYTNLEVEMGEAKEAMLRLLPRAQAKAGDAELFAGLVQACRYCGLLEASVAAYERARRLDPAIRTSVAHAYLMLGDYARAIETNVENLPSTTAWALSLMGRDAEAIELAKSLEQSVLPRLSRRLIVATRALLEGRLEESREATDQLLDGWRLRDPCSLYYLARHLARLGDAPRALGTLVATVEGGFYCYSFMTRDPWLDSLRGDLEFKAILRRAEARRREAHLAFLAAGGGRILGMGAE